MNIFHGPYKDHYYYLLKHCLTKHLGEQDSFCNNGREGAHDF